MRARSSFGKWIQKVFAAIMRNLFPTISVKYFTIEKTNLDSWSYSPVSRRFCPGMQKELAAIEKLHLSDEEISVREWSRETRVELLKRGNYTLLDRIRVTEEIDAVCDSGNVDVIAKLFLFNTPSRDYLKRFMRRDPNLVEAVILKNQSIFNDLSLADFSALDADVCYRYLRSLINYSTDCYPKNKRTILKWAEAIIKTWCQTDFSKDAEKKAIFDEAMKVLIAEDYNFIKLLDNLEQFQYASYCLVRDKAEESTHAIDYVVKMLPDKWYQVGEELNNKLPRFLMFYRDLDSAKDAETWMCLAYRNLNNPKVCAKVLEVCTYLEYTNLSGLEKVLQEAVISEVSGFDNIALALSKIRIGREALVNKLVASITNVDEAAKAFIITPKEYHDRICAIMVDKIDGSNAHTILSYFPFKDWNLGEQAVRKLARLKKLPVHRISELSEELQQAAQEELEVQSEIGMIYDDSECQTFDRYKSQLQRLIERKSKLHARSEHELFLHLGMMFNEYYPFIEKYVSLHKMAESSFAYLLSCDKERNGAEFNHINDIAALINLHAQKWGLSLNNYQMLMQSSYSHMAPLLKQYVK